MDKQFPSEERREAEEKIAKLEESEGSMGEPDCSTDEPENRITWEFLLEAMAEHEKLEKSGKLHTLRSVWHMPRANSNSN